MQDDGDEDVEEDGDQILQPIVILDQLSICKETKVWVRPPWPNGFPGKDLVGSSLDGDTREVVTMPVVGKKGSLQG